jgi:hypothetical protein
VSTTELRTADGVAVKPGMVLFVDMRQRCMQHCEKVDRIENGHAISAYAGTIFRGGIMDLSICYSSMQAIVAASCTPPAPDPTTIARQHWEDCGAQGKHLHSYYAEAAIDEPAKAIETAAMFDADHPASKLLLLPADEFLATALRWRDSLVMDMNDLADDWMLTRPDPDEPAADADEPDEDQARDIGGKAADRAYAEQENEWDRRREERMAGE